MAFVVSDDDVVRFVSETDTLGVDEVFLACDWSLLHRALFERGVTAHDAGQRHLRVGFQVALILFLVYKAD